MSPALVDARTENKQLRAALARTALKLLGAAHERMKLGVEWKSYALVGLNEYRRATDNDAALVFGFAAEMKAAMP